MKTSISITKVKGSRVGAIIDLIHSDTDFIHIDMMDGIFVDNKQLLSDEVLSLTRGISKKLDIHMMIADPIPYIRELQELDNINNITIHEEIGNTDYYIDCIHELGLKAGVAINPDTSVDRLLPFLDNLDIVLIMGVYPGKGGQSLIEDTVKKIKQLVDLRDKFGLSYDIEFDGGVNGDNKKLLKGLDIVVSGSYVCLSDDMQEKIDILRW